MNNNISLVDVAAKLLGRPILQYEPVYQGRNSGVFCLECADGARYCAKRYFANTLDGRSRLQIEFGSLKWLRDQGIKQVPMPVAADPSSNVAIYQWIDGEPGENRSLTADDIDVAADFLLALNSLKGQPGAAAFPSAAEACFSFQELIEVIRRRISILRETVGPISQSDRSDSEIGPTMRRFLDEDVAPLLDKVIQAIPAELLPESLDGAQRILSPSDFGFHNAIRRQDGEWVFVDFEYFGWDDPAKMICDFLLHPAMNLAEPLKKRFVARLLPCLVGRTVSPPDQLLDARTDSLPHEPTHHLEKRLPVAYALFGIKWSLILLNEFVPEHLARRRFSGETREPSEILAGQLEKARAMLKKTWEI